MNKVERIWSENRQLTKPIPWVLRRIAGKNQHNKLIGFGLGIGRYLGISIGGLIGAILTIGTDGTLLRGRFFTGFFFSHTGERGFLVGGVVGALCLCSTLVLIGKLRFKHRGSYALTSTPNIQT